MLTFLKIIPGKDWIYLGLMVTLLIGFGVYTKHERNIGAAKTVAAFKISTEKLQRETAALTADLKARADLAEQAHAKEILALSNRPPIQSVRLCVNSGSRPVVPAGSSKVAGNANPGSSSSGVQQVPSGDSSVAGPDIGGLLDLLALRGDKVSATLREFQKR